MVVVIEYENLSNSKRLELLLDIISKSSPVAYRKKGDSFVLYEKVNK